MSDFFRSPELLSSKSSHVLVVDVQEKLLPVIESSERILNEIRLLLDAASVLEVSVTVSEQYPKGLGATVSMIAEHAAVGQTFDKLRFSAAHEFTKHLANLSGETGRSSQQVILVGIESHICILQTALDLKDAGCDVFVVVNAVGSRRQTDHQSALVRMSHSGVRLLTTESVIFEWCETAGTDQFRQVSRLVRSHTDSARSET